MQAYGRRLLLRDSSRTASHVFSRHASLTGAINRGIRKTQRGVETAFEGVRNNRSDDARERAPWNSKPEQRSFRDNRPDRGWQGDVKRFGEEARSSARTNAFEGSNQRSGRSYDAGRDGGNGGGFNRDNADRRMRYQDRKDGTRERGPPPNRDGPNREERRRAQFGEPYSGKPRHDNEFMESHIQQQGSTTPPSRRERPSVRSEGPRRGESEFEEEYTKPFEGGWKAEDIEKEWVGRKPTFQPEFTRARDMQRMNRRDREDWSSGNDGGRESRNFGERRGENKNTDRPARSGRAPPEEGFRRAHPSGDHFIPRDDAPNYRRRHEEDLEEDEDIQVPSLEQRRNKYRPARKAERSVLNVESTSKISTTAPASVPFTTAAATFLHGTFSVQEAIRAGRRTLYTLYIYRGSSIEAPTTPESYHLISKLALTQGVKVKEIAGEGWSRLLNKMTNSRPHNGYVLEASEIPKLPVVALNRLEQPGTSFPVSLGHQSAEDRAINAPLMQPANDNGSADPNLALIPSPGGMARFPLLLLLDRIMDPGNLGAIVRSAHFLGVDALLLLEHSTAPFNAVTLKVAAGAAEYLPILLVKNEHDLIKSSKGNGWRFFAAMSEESGSAVRKTSNGKDVAGALSQGPVVLMLGSEGEGLRAHLAKLADGVASIKNARGENAGIDSLNVSVASALLCQEFLRGPHQVAVAEEADEQIVVVAPELSETVEDAVIDNVNVEDAVIENVSEETREGEETSQQEAETLQRQEEKVF